MARLYPPYIEGTLPAFWLNSKGDGVIAIPFTLNKAVGLADISSFSVRVKTVQNDVLLGEIKIDGSNTAGIADELDYTNENNAGFWELEESKGGGTLYLIVNDGYILHTNVKLIVGQFYKVQVAFIEKLYSGDEGSVGYYSTVGVVKCTSKPIVTIEGFSETKANNSNTEFVGKFKQPFIEGKGSEYSGDITEKVYSCNFKIYNEDREVVYESGELAHSVENNVNSYESEDHWRFFRELEDKKIYTIIYTVTTNNNLVVSSPEYILVEQRAVEMGYHSVKLHTKLYKDDGYIAVSLSQEDPKEKVAGMFVLSRADATDPTYWMELTRFGCHNEMLYEDNIIFKDFTIEQGKTYTYRIKRYNAYNIYSEPLEAEPIYADFDDMFIYDGKRQLKVEFNPQMSSFKTQLAESRNETIGGKYPFFFRNARVGYKTFPISGLISMQMDESELFTTYEEILRTDYSRNRYRTRNKTSNKSFYESYFISNDHDNTGIYYEEENEENVPLEEEDEEEEYVPEVEFYADGLTKHPVWHKNLVDENFASERLFKLKVLDWLNDGKVKLIRTPGEGNYLIRLMDVSLTPNTTVGRMLHTFNATAYEAAPFDYDSMVLHKILKSVPKEDVDDYVIFWRKIDYPSGSSNWSHHYYTKNREYSENLFYSDILNGYTKNIEFQDWLPGSEFKLITDPSGEYKGSGINIKIGPTGSLILDDIQKIYGIYWHKPIGHNLYTNNLLADGGTIRYQYQDQIRDTFNLISETETDIGGLRQCVGKGLEYELVKDYLEVVDYEQPDESLVRLSDNRNSGNKRMPSEQVSKLYDVKLFKRPINYVYYGNENGGTFDASKIFADGNIGMGKQGNRKFATEAWSNLFWDSYLKNPVRKGSGNDENQDQYIMEHSPFGLFLVKDFNSNDSNVEGILDIRKKANVPTQYYGEDPNNTDHFNEGTFVDRWLTQTTAEKELFEAIFDKHNSKHLYVLDFWLGRIYKTPDDNDILKDMFKVIYNKNAGETPRETTIDLQDMEWLSLDNLTTKATLYDPAQSVIKMGVGVRAQVMFSKITTTFAVAYFDKSIATLRETWEGTLSNIENIAAEREAYANYIRKLNIFLDNYVAKDKNNYYMKRGSGQYRWDTQW